MTPVYIAATVLVLVCIIAILIFNRFVKMHNRLKEAWSGILVQLKKRNDLIPNLLETVKGYAGHEKEALETVVRLRTEGTPKNAGEASEQEKKLMPAMGRLLALSESYPDLKANQNFLQLQASISNIEEDLQMSRRYFNGVVRDYNIMVESFPSLIVAQLCGYKIEEFFVIDESEKAVPQISF